MRRRLVSVGATLCLLFAATLALATGAGGAFRHGKEIVRIEAEPERAMAYGKSGLLLLVQFFQPYEKGLVRLRGDGSLDRSFGDRGRVMIPWDDVVVQGDGGILILTTTETPGSTGAEDPVLMRLLPNGRPDPSFGQGGGIRVDLGGQFDHGTALALAPGGKIVLAGRSASKGEPRGGEGDARTVLVRLELGGTLDPSFANGGVKVLLGAVPVFDLANGPHRTLMVAADEDEGLSIGIYRLHDRGNLDSSYGNGESASVSGFKPPRGYDFIDLIPKLGVLPSGKVLLAGTVSRPLGRGELQYNAVAVRLRADGERDRSYGMRGYATAGVAGDFFPQSFAVQRNGRVLVVGDAQIRGGTNDILALAFSPKGKLDRGFGRRGSSRVQFAHESDGRDILLRRHVAILVGSSLPNRGSGRIAVARVPLGHRPVR